jgi:uncharacterized SAM-binding protein YcdF (DUF218 family)
MIRRAISFLLLLYVVGYVLFVLFLPSAADDRQTDAIVVLTGGSKRIERGLDLLKRGRAKRMLVSGVERSVRPEDLAREYSTDPAVFKCCIDLGREAIDTRSNAQETAQWIDRRKVGSVRLVTTDWHMPRARFELKRQLGDKVEMVGDAVPSNPSFTQLFTEYNKYVLRRGAVLVGI